MGLSLIMAVHIYINLANSSPNTVYTKLNLFALCERVIKKLKTIEMPVRNNAFQKLDLFTANENN